MTICQNDIDTVDLDDTLSRFQKIRRRHDRPMPVSSHTSRSRGARRRMQRSPRHAAHKFNGAHRRYNKRVR